MQSQSTHYQDVRVTFLQTNYIVVSVFLTDIVIVEISAVFNGLVDVEIWEIEREKYLRGVADELGCSRGLWGAGLCLSCRSERDGWSWSR